MKNKVRERVEKKVSYYLHCPIVGCDKEIKGSSKNQILYNMKLHIQAHKKLESQKSKTKGEIK